MMHTYRSLSGVICLATSLLLSVVAAGEHPYIAGIVNGTADDKIKGLVLLEELNCVACHQGNAKLAAASKVAPRLARVGERVNPWYLEAFLASPHTTKPGTTMPDLLAQLPEVARKQTARELTHFLLALGESKFKPTGPDAFAAERGKAVFHAIGCVACHSPRDDNGNELMPDNAVPLGALQEKYSVRSLSDFLRNAHKIRPSGRMPNLRLGNGELESLSHYLLEETRVPGSLSYKMYQGNVWEGLDNEVRKVKAGLANDFDLKHFGKIQNNSLIVFDGYLRVEQAGRYQFFLQLNGGELVLKEKVVASLKPHHHRGTQKLEATASLTAGWNPIQLRYFNMGRNPALTFEMTGPGFERRAIPAEMLSISETPIPAYQPYPIDSKLAATGRVKFASMGCASCHDDVKESSPAATAFAALESEKGCLSPQRGAWPHFGLSRNQISLLQGILSQAETVPLSPKEKIAKTLTGLNCIACHDRKGVGGISEASNPYFTGEHKELGNEGRIPPPLDLVGAKLQKPWLAAVLMNAARQREYLHVRMPQFGNAQVSHLVDLFAQVDKVEPVVLPPVVDLAAYKEAGRKMVGGEGFTCIACHDFNGQKSAGGGLELVTLPTRLQKDWYYHYMLNPSHFRPGIIMPPYWPGGNSMRKDILGGDSKKQIDAIWIYLQDGAGVKAPAGLSRQSPELRVADEPVMCRGRGSSAGYRGIAVGYPKGVNIAFDSEQMNLKVIWKGSLLAPTTAASRQSGKNG